MTETDKEELEATFLEDERDEELGIVRKLTAGSCGVQGQDGGIVTCLLLTGLKNEMEEKFFPVPFEVERLKEEEWDELEVYRYAVIVRYNEKALEETAVPNIVTVILIDYRGYDTLFETTAIFSAGITVILLLRRIEKL